MSMQNQNASIRLIRLPDVIAITGLRRSTVYALIRDNKFPKQVQLGTRGAAWVESEIQDWMMQRIAARQQS